MKKRKLVVPCSLIAATGLSATARRPEPIRPNIVLIVSDDQGYGDFRCYGNELIRTPNLDRLYEESTRLNRFYVDSVCAPTRAGLLTGRYAYRAGVWDTWKGRENLRASEYTLARALADAGYRTGQFGKWHLGENVPFRPQDHGFQETLLWADVSSRFNPGMEHNGELKRFEGFLDDILFDQALSFIDESRRQPFFCYVASFMPHDYPLGQQAPDEDLALYADEESLRPEDREVYAMVTRMDRNIGRLLDGLKERGLDETTLVVFFPDNGPLLTAPSGAAVPGESRYNAGLRDGKFSVYDGGIKVPCFFRWNGVLEPGREIETRAAHIDLYPTLLDLCGIRLPDQVAFDGRSIRPQLFGEEAEGPERLIFNQFHRAAQPVKWHNAAVIGERFKLVNGTELYDLKADPGETADIASDYPEEVERLRAGYEEWFAAVFAEGITGERARVQIGSERQPDLRLKYWHASDEDGYYTEVVSPGPYTFRFTGLQHDLFDETTRFTLSVNGKRILEFAPESGQQQELILSAVTLPPGSCDLKVDLENPTEERRLTYGERDPGFRFLFIRKAQETN